MLSPSIFDWFMAHQNCALEHQLIEFEGEESIALRCTEHGEMIIVKGILHDIVNRILAAVNRHNN